MSLKEVLFKDVWDKIGTWSFVFPKRKRECYVSDDNVGEKIVMAVNDLILFWLKK